MDCIKGKYIYKKKDISFLIIRKIELIVSQIANKEKTSFENAYEKFLASNTYKAIQEPRSLLWGENAEFIVDEYYRDTKK
ncbi:hypothetical protein AGMMS49938_02370 [Fibrobacterales bacterium]|nr:hypothetical protein AGMMS49938_02370 [Fibrobacterales bacterium]